MKWCVFLFSLLFSLAGALVINELDYNQVGTDTAEYIELYNEGTTAVQLSDYTLYFINGAGESFDTNISLFFRA